MTTHNLLLTIDLEMDARFHVVHDGELSGTLDRLASETPGTTMLGTAALPGKDAAERIVAAAEAWFHEGGFRPATLHSAVCTVALWVGNYRDPELPGTRFEFSPVPGVRW